MSAASATPGCPALDAAPSPPQWPAGWAPGSRLNKADRTAQIDAAVALAQAVERATARPEPVQLLGWL